MFDKADNFHGEILGVEWLSSGRDPETKQRWAAGWRVSISEVEMKEGGSIASKEEGDELTYEINDELIAMVIQSPYNKFLTLLAAAAAHNG